MLARQSHSVSLTAVVASVLHSVIVQTVLALPSFSTPVYEVGYGGRNSAFVQSTVVAITLFPSLLLYLYTGIPGIFTKRCDTCGEANALGKAWCHNCGTVRGVESFSLQRLGSSSDTPPSQFCLCTSLCGQPLLEATLSSSRRSHISWDTVSYSTML